MTGLVCARNTVHTSGHGLIRDPERRGKMLATWLELEVERDAMGCNREMEVDRGHGQYKIRDSWPPEWPARLPMHPAGK